MKKLLLSLVILAATMLPTASAAAINPFQAVCPSGAAQSTSAVCKASGGDPLTTKTGVLHSVTLLVAAIAGIAAVIVIVVAGIVYITSGGDAEKVKKAKRAIIYAAIGLLVIALGQTIITIAIGGLS